MVSTALAGVFRSLRLYQGAAAPKREMDALYAQFVKSGDLVFDIGAHAGDRISSFRRLGARVVAMEPQPLLVRALSLIHGRDADVLILAGIAAAEACHMTMHINSANPTVSTASHAFIASAKSQDGWHGQSWDVEITSPARSLESLIKEYGEPTFIKVDVEGFEYEVLQGLRTPVAALSFEFTTIARDVAMRCLDRIAQLGSYRYDIALGESQRMHFGHGVQGQEMAAHLSNLPHAANSGDVYAWRTAAD